MPVTTAVFYLLAAVTLGSACGVAFGTNILYSAFALMGTFLGVAAIFVLLGADFLGVIQLFVYPSGWPQHILWIGLLLPIIAQGPGILSLDHLVWGRMRSASKPQQSPIAAQ